MDEHGKPAQVRASVSRAKLIEAIAALPRCTIGMEACSGAHHWARQFGSFGHSVRLMAPRLVSPYRMSGKRGKNDAADEVQTLRAPILVVSGVKLFTTLIRPVVNLPRC